MFGAKVSPIGLLHKGVYSWVF